MKIKIGPVEVEQDPIKDEVLFGHYKESPKEVEKYLDEKSKFLDLTIKNLIAGRTVKMIKDFIFSLVASVVFIGWSLYVFYVSKDAFVWEKLDLQTTFYILLQALLIIAICFLPVILIGGFIKLVSKLTERKTRKK